MPKLPPPPPAATTSPQSHFSSPSSFSSPSLMRNTSNNNNSGIRNYVPSSSCYMSDDDSSLSSPEKRKKLDDSIDNNNNEVELAIFAREGEEMVCLVSSDEQKFKISREAIKISSFIEDVVLVYSRGYDDSSSEDSSLKGDAITDSMMKTDDGNGNQQVKEVPLQRVKGSSLSKIVDFCNHYHYIEALPEIKPPFKTSRMEDIVNPCVWYADFIKKMTWNQLQDLVLAANYLDIKPLLRLCVLGVSLEVKGKHEEELRPMFGIRNEPFDVPATSTNRWCDQYMESRVPSSVANEIRAAVVAKINA